MRQTMTSSACMIILVRRVERWTLGTPGLTLRIRFAQTSKGRLTHISLRIDLIRELAISKLVDETSDVDP